MSIRRRPIKFRKAHVWEILTSVGTTRLLTSSRRADSLDGALEEVTEFERFNKIPN